MVDEDDVVVVQQGVGRGVGVRVHAVRVTAAVVADVDHAAAVHRVLRLLGLPAPRLAWAETHINVRQDINNNNHDVGLNLGQLPVLPDWARCVYKSIVQIGWGIWSNLATLAATVGNTH